MTEARNDSADFFSRIAYVQGEDRDKIPETVPRDQWKRPLILDPQTGELVAYTRASSFADYIDNKHGLHKWQIRLLARGMGQREDLAAMAAALPPLSGKREDRKKDAEVKAELDEIIERALDTARAYEGADHGTAVHAFTDPWHVSGPPPERMVEDVRSHAEMIERTGIVRLASEVFVVNDELKVAGTLDAIDAVPALNAAVTSDTKTGKQNLHSTTIQVAIYARSKAYSAVTGERVDLGEYARRCAQGMGLGDGPAFNSSLGLYTHIPREQGKTTLHPLDLARGWYMAQICAIVRDWSRAGDFAKADAVEHLAENRGGPAYKAIGEASTMEELRAAYAAFKWCWHENLEAYGRRRMVEIGAGRA